MPKIVWKYSGKKYEMEKRVWHSMRSRCHNQKNAAYYRYGGRGIFMCDEWRNNFDQFYEDMGPRPPGMSLDRIDNDKGYSKDNCRWVTNRENSLNTRCALFVDVGDKKLRVHEIAAISGQRETTIRYRVKKGMPPEKLLASTKLPNGERRYPPRHGTYYEYQKYGCKCEPCKKAASEYKRNRYKIRQEKKKQQ